MQSSLENWKSSQPVFVIELNWGGVVYFLSTEPIEVESVYGTVKYIGGIEETPEFDQEIKEGFNLDSLFVSVACQISNVDIAAEVLSGRYLEQSEAELSMILVKNGQVLAYEERIQLFRGYVVQPVFGHVDKSQSYVEFSLESKVFDASVYALLVDSLGRHNSIDISAVNAVITSPLSPVLNAFNQVQIFEPHRGKQIPFVFGAPGRIRDQSGSVVDFPATPAYVLSHNAATNEIYVCIASHPVKDARVKLHTDRGSFAMITPAMGGIKEFVMSNGRIFSFVVFDLDLGLESIVTDNSVQYWISWIEGGYISPSKSQTMETGGDICLWLLSQGNADIDYASWESLIPFLNKYKFAGYIKESEETPIEFLDKNILPFLPISIVNGNEGLRAVPDLLSSGIPIIPNYEIVANPEFQRVAPVSTVTDANDIINSYTLEYARDGSKDAYRSIMRGKPNQVNYTNFTFSNLYAELSAQRFGVKERIESAPYIYDDSTAALICKDKIKKLGFPKRSTVFLASSRYGYLQIGDIIKLTDETLGLTARTVQITRKVYKFTNWEYTITLNDHQIQDIEQ